MESSERIADRTPGRACCLEVVDPGELVLDGRVVVRITIAKGPDLGARVHELLEHPLQLDGGRSRRNPLEGLHAYVLAARKAVGDALQASPVLAQLLQAHLHLEVAAEDRVSSHLEPGGDGRGVVGRERDRVDAKALQLLFGLLQLLLGVAELLLQDRQDLVELALLELGGHRDLSIHDGVQDRRDPLRVRTAERESDEVALLVHTCRHAVGQVTGGVPWGSHGEIDPGAGRKRARRRRPPETEVHADRVPERPPFDEGPLPGRERVRTPVVGDREPEAPRSDAVRELEGVERRSVLRRRVQVHPLLDHDGVEDRVRAEQLDPGVGLEEAALADGLDVASAAPTVVCLNPEVAHRGVLHLDPGPGEGRACSADHEGEGEQPLAPPHRVEVAAKVHATPLVLVVEAPRGQPGEHRRSGSNQRSATALPGLGRRNQLVVGHP